MRSVNENVLFCMQCGGRTYHGDVHTYRVKDSNNDSLGHKKWQRLNKQETTAVAYGGSSGMKNDSAREIDNFFCNVATMHSFYKSNLVKGCSWCVVTSLYDLLCLKQDSRKEIVLRTVL